MSREYPDRPLCGVGVVVWRGAGSDAEVLLIRRGRPPRAGQWSLPGGLQELGETVFDAAAREVREETGMAVRPTELIDVVDLIARDQAGRARYHSTLVDVTAEWEAGEPVPNDDVAHCEWLRPEDLPAENIWEETRRIILLSRERREA